MAKAVSMKQLQEAIGDDAVKILKRRFAGMQIYLSKNPEDPFPDKIIRNLRIKDDFYGGLSVSDLQIKYGLSKSRIHHILGMKQDIK